MSIRIQLLVIALTTLLLPWAGCQYARELESTLRVSQENSLQAAAATIANALSAQPQRVFGEVLDSAAFDPALGDLYVYPLHNQPLLDGYREDWNLAAQPTPLPAARLGARVLAGFTERYLFLYLEVDDPHFDPEPADAHPAQDRFDRVNLRFRWPDGARESYFFATSAPGLIEAQSILPGEDGSDHVISEARIQAFWFQTSRGYHLEARVPRTLVGSRLWIEAVDGASGDTVGLVGADGVRGGRLFSVTPGLGELLATFIGPGTRATVVDTNDLKLGLAGSLSSTREEGEAGDGEGTWYRRFVTQDSTQWPLQVSAADRVEDQSVKLALAGHPAAEWLRAGPRREALLTAAAPITVAAGTRGAVLLEQPGDQFIGLRDRALTHLFNLTLLATALAVIIAFGVAASISVRIGRLRSAADSAVGGDGHIRLAMPESQRADEIGALARGFERLLVRLSDHAQYLRTLGAKLSHELRTPLTIVRSSLDNLESEGVRAEQAGYVTRAREGVQRLQSILSALGAAARVEESIKQSERLNFDLKSLLESTVAGYRDGFRGTRIELELPATACYLCGAPDLIVQMLDKLTENAVDYCAAGGAITVRLRVSGSHYHLCVSNDGPPIPPAMLDRLFESLFEHREGHDDRPHFGLGLYIVRLIAEFHGGRAVAANRPDSPGAEFTVLLPLI